MPIVLYHFKIINIIFIHVRFITTASDVIFFESYKIFADSFVALLFQDFAETMRTVKREIYTESAIK